MSILFLFAICYFAQFIKLNSKSNFKTEHSTNVLVHKNNQWISSVTKEKENIPYWTKTSICENVLSQSDLHMTSPISSIVTLLNSKDGVVTVQINAYNGFNIPKEDGGDLFVLWAEQTSDDGRVAGEITDHRNGSYLGSVKLYWTGETIIRVKLVSTIENFCIRRISIIRYGDSAFVMQRPLGIIGTFHTNRTLEKTRCGNEPNLYGYDRKCNFTLLNDNNPWYCGAPQERILKCSHIHDFTMLQFNQTSFLTSSDNIETIKMMGHGELKGDVEVETNTSFTIQRNVPCNRIPRERSWSYNQPSGHYINGTWHNKNCKNTILFDNITYRKCFRNKTIAMFGDSTIRGYVDFFMTEVMHLPKVNWIYFRSENWTFHPPANFENHGIKLSFKSHEMPLYGFNVPAQGITSVPTEIIKLAKGDILGENLVLIMTYCPHLQAFSPELFRFKMRRLASAIEVLLKAKPKATVFIKGPYLFFQDSRWFDARVSLIQKDIMFDEFKALRRKVFYLDIWSITVAHNSEDKHPGNQAFDSQIQQLMSYLCSK